MKETERKFLTVELPNLSGISPISYERYYISTDENLEDRVQKKGNNFEREKKYMESDLTRRTEKKLISKEEFDNEKLKAKKAILRYSYLLSSEPEVSIKVYKGEYEGLNRVEVEFTSEEEATQYTPENWMGQEITNTRVGKDSKLVQMTREEFLEELKKFI